MTIAQDTTGLIITLETNLTSTTVEDLMSEWKTLLERPNPQNAVTLNIAKVTAIDSKGLNLLIGCYKECLKRHWQFRITGSSKEIKRMFTLLKLNDHFGVK